MTITKEQVLVLLELAGVPSGYRADVILESQNTEWITDFAQLAYTAGAEAKLQSLLAGVKMPEPVYLVYSIYGWNPVEKSKYYEASSTDRVSLFTETQLREYAAAAVAKKDVEIAHLQQDCQTEAATVVMLTAERDSLAEDLRDERQRGLALLADAKEWQAQLAKSEVDLSYMRAERDALAAKVQSLKNAFAFVNSELLERTNQVRGLREALQAVAKKETP